MNTDLHDHIPIKHITRVAIILTLLSRYPDMLSHSTALTIEQLQMKSTVSDLQTRCRHLDPGPRFNIKMSYQYRKSHYGDKTVVRISYTGKMASLYWFSPLSGIRGCYEGSPSNGSHGLFFLIWIDFNPNIINSKVRDVILAVLSRSSGH